MTRFFLIASQKIALLPVNNNSQSLSVRGTFKVGDSDETRNKGGSFLIDVNQGGQ